MWKRIFNDLKEEDLFRSVRLLLLSYIFAVKLSGNHSLDGLWKMKMGLHTSKPRLIYVLKFDRRFIC